MRKRIRSLVCKSKKAHERSRHGHAVCIRRSARGGWNGLLRDHPRCPMLGAPPLRGLTDFAAALVRRQHHPAVHGAGRRAGITRLGPSACGVVVNVTGQKRRGLFKRRAPDHPAAFEHRARPPHPAPRLVTIAKRPSSTGRGG